MSRLLFKAALVLAIALTANIVHGQTGRLEFADKVRMVHCEPASDVPCFRVKVNLVDGQGAPLPAALPPADTLTRNLTIKVDQQELAPFYAAAATDAKAVRPRDTLILIDISGSMNKLLPNGLTRFQAAKLAMSEYLDGFDPKSDRIAIVPFESHHVADAITTARFAATKEQAQQLIDSLPVPQPHNNTGLYSAVALGIDVLTRQAKLSANASPESLLIVMTDGKNEVFSGDDTGLLAGPSGLEQATRKVQGSGYEVIGIGFGNAASVDVPALQRFSTKFYLAEDAETLKHIFSMAHTLLNSRVQATFASPWPDRASLAGRNFRVAAQLQLPNGETLQSTETSWAAPEIGLPLYEGNCETAELKALINSGLIGTSTVMSVLRPILVFVGLGLLLLLMWFWIPRLIWPHQYIGTVPTSGNVRWAAATRFGAKPVKPAPPGFEIGKAARAAQRSAGDATIVQPRDFSQTRLRKYGQYDE